MLDSTTTNVPAGTLGDLVAALIPYGVNERAAMGIVQGNMPARLCAARLISMYAAQPGSTIKESDAETLFDAYGGNGARSLPSFKSQASKFTTFVRAGAKGIGVQTIDAVQRYIVDRKDAKLRDKFGGTNNNLGSAYEITLKVLRAANKTGFVPSHEDIAAILTPKPSTDDVVQTQLEAAVTALNAAIGERPYVGSDIATAAQHVSRALSKHIAWLKDDAATRNTNDATQNVAASRAEAAPEKPKIDDDTGLPVEVTDLVLTDA